MIDITLLGTAALMPLPDRALTAALLSCGGHGILFDCGEGTQTAGRRARANPLGVDMIALTHYHGDHTFGLPGLLQTMHAMGRQAPLLITGPAGLREAMAPILALAGHTDFPVALEPVPEGGLDLPERFPGWPARTRLAAFPTAHRGPSQGYAFTLGREGRFDPDRARALGVPQGLWRRLQAGETAEGTSGPVAPSEVVGPPRRGLKFVFSGDTRPCPALVEAARGADLMICEATFADEGVAEAINRHGHTLFSQAGAMAAEAGVQRLWLAHFSQAVGDPAEHLPLARAHFPAAECGEDGKRITLRFDAGPAGGEDLPRAGTAGPR